MKQKRMKQSNLTQNCEAETEVIRTTIVHNNIEKENKEIKSKHLEQQNNLALSPRQEVLNNEINNNLEVTGKCLTTPRNNDNRSIIPNLNNNSRQNNKSPYFNDSKNWDGFIWAITRLQQFPLRFPLILATGINTGSVTSRTENRILTPTQYRNKNRAVCDSSTQTEQIEFNKRSEAAENTNNNQKYISEKLTNLELNYDNRNRKERKSRSDDRSVDEKPKWSANRPPTRYMKQIFNMAKLDDFLGKKATAPILDLSKTEEFRRLLEKVPDFKIKSEQVHMESINIKDKKFKFKSEKNDVKDMKEPGCPIDWKMLTMIRPKSKLEENYFSRLVELNKLENKTRAFEKRQFVQDLQIRKLKNKAGVVEMRIVTCVDCGEDFCNGI
ncbi:MSA 2 domain containing protein, partial [Asbolus verrucosus]